MVATVMLTTVDPHRDPEDAVTVMGDPGWLAVPSIVSSSSEGDEPGMRPMAEESDVDQPIEPLTPVARTGT